MCVLMHLIQFVSVPFFLQIKKTVAATEIHVAREVTRHLCFCLLCGCGRLGSCSGCGGIGLAAVSRLLTVIVALTTAEFQILQNDTGHAALLLGLFILPGILIVTAAQVDKGTFLELHLTNAIHQRRVKALNRQIDPAVIVFCAGVIGLFASVTLIGVEAE